MPPALLETVATFEVSVLWPSLHARLGAAYACRISGFHLQSHGKLFTSLAPWLNGNETRSDGLMDESGHIRARIVGLKQHYSTVCGRWKAYRTILRYMGRWARAIVLSLRRPICNSLSTGFPGPRSPGGSAATYSVTHTSGTGHIIT